jgi:hypothetical protein
MLQKILHIITFLLYGFTVFSLSVQMCGNLLAVYLLYKGVGTMGEE